MVGDVVRPTVECDVCRTPQAFELDELSDYRTNDPNNTEEVWVELSFSEFLKRNWVVKNWAVRTLSVLRSTQSQHTFAAERCGHSTECRSESRLELLP